MRRITIARHPDLSLVEARAKALKLRHDIATGAHFTPESAGRRGEPTIAYLAALYVERHSRPHKRSWAEDERKIKLHFRAFDTVRISALTTEGVADWHQQLGRRTGRYMANRCLSLLATMFNLAIRWKLAASNPTIGVKRFREERRERFLNAEEVNRLFKSLDEEASPYWTAFFRLAILLGCRKSELLSARWQDINLDERVWLIPQTKAGRPHRLPLPAAAIDVLTTLPSRGNSPWLFSSDKHPGQRLSRADDAWPRIRQRAGIRDVRIHDLRRTLGSWLAAQGCSLPLIGKTLNHSDVATTQIYARLSLEPVRLALEKNATLMLNQTYPK
jgi:integrase